MKTEPLSLPGTEHKRDFPAQPDGGPLRPWHELFHSTYQEQLDAEAEKLGDSQRPVLIRIDDILVLSYAGQRHELEVADAAYHRYKTIAHVPLAIYQYLSANDPAILTTTEFNAIASALDMLAEDDQADTIVNACHQFINDVRARRVISAQALEALREQYVQATRLLVQRAADEAVAALDEALGSHEELVADPMHWSGLFCVVCSGHQPRYGELSKQYFRQYLQARNIGDIDWEHRLIYAEGVSEVDEALRLVAQRLVDARLGAALLGNSVRLNQDILSHAASVALERPRKARPW